MSIDCKLAESILNQETLNSKINKKTNENRRNYGRRKNS